MTKWILGPVLCAIGIAFIVAATGLFVTERDSDPILRAVGPLIGVYVAVGGIAIDAVVLGVVYIVGQQLEGRR